MNVLKRHTTMSPKPLSQLAGLSRPVRSDITVLIPTLGRAILEESLCCIAAGSAWPAQVMVVDQGQNPAVAAMMAQLQQIGIQTAYLSSPQRGRARGLNRGLAQVNTPYVAITDDDCFVQEDWLEKLAEGLRREENLVITGRVDDDGEGSMLMTVTSRQSQVQRRPRLSFDKLSGGNMGTSMAVLRRVGFFDEDERLRTAEDGEWAYRALRAGVAIRYDPAIAVIHAGWREEAGRLEQYRSYARSQGGFYGKYLRRGDVFIALRIMVHLLRSLRRWMRGALLGNPEIAALGRAYFTHLLPGVLAGLRRSSTP